MTSTSRLFEGYRSLGLISSSIPHLIRYVDRINKIQIITAVGRSFLVFNQKLQLIETCVAHSTDIQVLAADSRLLFTAAGSELFAWKYGHKWKVKSFKGARGSLTHLLVFGPQLLAIDATNTLLIWDIESEELSLTLPFSSEGSDDEQEDRTGENSFIISALLHPATYINKILLGATNGQLQLWNVAKQKLVYRFPGWAPSPITKLSQAPALHVVAVGHESGLIVLHHLKEDTTLMRFNQEWGPVLDLSFRTDDAATLPILISSSTTGHLAVWNLDARRLETQMRDLAAGAIVGAQFVAKQPLLVTNSADNSLKVYVFDDLQTSGRVLYQREGHHLPPTRIRFYGDRGQYILSSGLDSSLRAFFIYSERKNRNLGTASYNRKQTKKKGVARDHALLEPIVDYAFETVRQKEWDNLVAIHRDTPFVTSWSFDRMRMGEHKLAHERFAGVKTLVHATSLTMSVCGHFVLIGYNTGHLDRFNIQSGLHRCAYTVDSVDSTGTTAHSGAVRGVVSDGLNQLVVSGGADRALRFWRFTRGEPVGTLSLAAPVNILHLHRDNSLLAASLDNFHLIIVDLETKKVVRRFTSHAARITDLTFDRDGRRLYVASMDSLIYTWDMLTGQLVDGFRTVTPCVSLTMSPTGEFLATAHVNDLGIYLWANLSIYSVVTLMPLDVRTVQDRARVQQLPQIRSDEEEVDEEEDEEGDDKPEEPIDDKEDRDIEPIDYQYKSPEQLAEDLITLSSQPSSRWKNLLKLDLIRQRNKPQEPVEKPKAAPFFLPTIAGIEPKFNLDPKNQTGSDPTAEARRFQLHFMSEFVRLLDKCPDDEDNAGPGRAQQLASCFAELTSYGPSKIDAELRTLGPESTDGTSRYLYLFLDMIEWALGSNRDFELAQSYLGLFAHIHLETLAKESGLLERCRTIGAKAEGAWRRLESDFDRSICLISFLRNAVI